MILDLSRFTSKLNKNNPELLAIGWQEWCALSVLDLPVIKAKIDTGAKTSALHAFDIKAYRKNAKDFVQFKVHPLQNNENITVNCRAPLVDQRYVTNSGGQQELRYIIKTHLTLGNRSWEIEMSLTDRQNMRFRLLLGRQAFHRRVIIHPHRIFLTHRIDKHDVEKVYRERKAHFK